MKCESCGDFDHLLKNCPKSKDKSKIDSIIADEALEVKDTTKKKPKPLLRKKSSMIFICYTLSYINAKCL